MAYISENNISENMMVGKAAEETIPKTAIKPTNTSTSAKTAFMQEYENGITIEEARKQTHAKIDSLWSK